MTETHSTSLQADPPLSRASLAPTGFLGRIQRLRRTRKTVGASLLAMTETHPTSRQADPPLSQASLAPTAFLGRIQRLRMTQKTVGASMLANTHKSDKESRGEKDQL